MFPFLQYKWCCTETASKLSGKSIIKFETKSQRMYDWWQQEPKTLGPLTVIGPAPWQNTFFTLGLPRGKILLFLILGLPLGKVLFYILGLQRGKLLFFILGLPLGIILLFLFWACRVPNTSYFYFGLAAWQNISFSYFGLAACQILFFYFGLAA